MFNSFGCLGFSDFLFAFTLCCQLGYFQLSRSAVVNSSLRVNNSLMDLVNASLISSWFRSATATPANTCFNSAPRRRRLSGCVVIWRCAEPTNGLARAASSLPVAPLGRLESFWLMSSNASSASAVHLFSVDNCDLTLSSCSITGALDGAVRGDQLCGCSCFFGGASSGDFFGWHSKNS